MRELRADRDTDPRATRSPDDDRKPARTLVRVQAAHDNLEPTFLAAISNACLEKPFDGGSVRMAVESMALIRGRA